MPNQCCCDGPPEVSCSNCFNDEAPFQIAVTISGFSNAACGNCEGLDGTYVLDYWGEASFGGSPSTCYWYDSSIDTPPSDCGMYGADGTFGSRGMILSIYRFETGGGPRWNITVTFSTGSSVSNYQTYSWTTRLSSDPVCTGFEDEVIGLLSTSLPTTQCTSPSTVLITSL